MAGETGGTRDVLAAVAGVVFLAHPVQTESVAYVASRSETLSVFFAFGAFAVYLYTREHGLRHRARSSWSCCCSSRRSPRRSTRWRCRRCSL